MFINIVFVVLSTLVLIDATFLEWEAKHPPFDPNIYEEVLDPELCAKQIQYLTLNDTLLLMTFSVLKINPTVLESGPRLPRGILQGNLLDLGNYHQCLGINTEIDDMVIDGKYCQISIGLSDLVNLGSATELESVKKASDTIKDEVYLYERIQKHLETLDGIERKKYLRTGAGNIDDLHFSVAICIPKPCSIRQALPNLLGAEVINFEEQYCRFKNDKPWAPGVYVAIVIFSLIVLLAILSTSYDIWNTLIRKRDPKTLNKIHQSFSVYTNSRRLITFNPVRGAIECVDGIRAITMVWIVIGHLFAFPPTIVNNLDFYQWIFSWGSMWLTGAPIGVDTFFMMSGLLIVYTSVGKLSNMKLLKNLHLFYLNRYLRLFPLLASTVLLQIGVLHYIHDGANWLGVAALTERCRRNWWSSILYVQNYIRPTCLPQTWYLGIDMQLHIVSPLILFWVLSSKKKIAWSALAIAVLASLTATSIYNFLSNFTGTDIRPILSAGEMDRYYRNYYFNTFTRSPPFFLGMCFGYLIHYWRERNIRITKVVNGILWVFSLAILSFAFYATTPMKNADFDKQIYDNFVNSFMRPVWALGLGWLILACAEGYGGPINWFLSLQFWKLPSRLSFAIYLLHLPIQFVIRGAATQHIYFSALNFIYICCGQFVIIFMVSFVFTILVDSPCCILFKILLGGGIKKPKSEELGDKRNIRK